ncbi:hypothetical protein ACJZ2D_004114 [Fusarium nematophilum]
MDMLFNWKNWSFWRGAVAGSEESELPAVQVANRDDGITPAQIEDYPSGYPQYSALISSYDPFFAFRSFRQLRARLLLLKQDELSVLEAQLNQMDREETSPFFRGTFRGDRNTTRAEVLAQIHSNLKDYGKLTITPSNIHADHRDLDSLQNWLEETGCLTEEETSYLHTGGDLVNLASSRDPAMKQLEDWVEERLIRHYKGFRAKGPRVRDLIQLACLYLLWNSDQGHCDNSDVVLDNFSPPHACRHLHPLGQQNRTNSHHHSIYGVLFDCLIKADKVEDDRANIGRRNVSANPRPTT